MELQEAGWGGMDWIHLVGKWKVSGACARGNEPSGSV